MQYRYGSKNRWAFIGHLLAFCITFATANIQSAFADSWETQYSTHYIYKYQTGLPKDFLLQVKSKTEELYRTIMNNLGLVRSKFWLWDNRCTVYIYKSREDFLANSGLPSWSQGGAIKEKREIHIYPGSEYLFDSILPHELTHLLFYEATGGAFVPVCIDEGVATNMELGEARRLSAYYIIIQNAAEGKVVDFEGLIRMGDRYQELDTKEAQIFYSQSYLFIEFLLNKFPRSYFADFCWRLKNGRNFYRAFVESYGKYNAFNKIDSKKLNDDYFKYIAENSPYKYNR